VSRRATLDVEIRSSFSLMWCATRRSYYAGTLRMLIGGEKLHLFYLFYQVEIR